MKCEQHGWQRENERCPRCAFVPGIGAEQLERQRAEAQRAARARRPETTSKSEMKRIACQKGEPYPFEATNCGPTRHNASFPEWVSERREEHIRSHPDLKLPVVMEKLLEAARVCTLKNENDTKYGGGAFVPVAPEELLVLIQACACREAYFAKLEAKIEALRIENLCDACVGEKLACCMCSGTGKMSEAARYLRKELFAARAKLKLAADRIDGLVARIELCCSTNHISTAEEWYQAEIKVLGNIARTALAELRKA